jgi:RND family efflux transporter MFP subunit
VTAGQVLATLDPQPFELNVQAANSELAAADANRTEKKNVLDRQLTLYEKGWVSKAALDQAFSSFDAAEANLNLARSRLGTSERELAKTRLTAPFDGLIAVRDVEPFEEVTPGAAAFRINSEGALEIDLAVSDSVVSRLAVGASVNVDISAITECGCAGRITEIGTSSGSANSVPVTAALLNGPPDVLPGMSAEVSVILSSGDGARGFLVPLSAIVPGDAEAPGYIFKFDPEARVVRKVAVRGGDGVVDNFIAIVEGVGAGDIVAAAGVSFLRDGQSVKLLGE